MQIHNINPRRILPVNSARRGIQIAYKDKRKQGKPTPFRGSSVYIDPQNINVKWRIDLNEITYCNTSFSIYTAGSFKYKTYE